MAIAKVEPLTTARALRGPFDYRLPERLGEVGVGSVVRVPFGRRRVLGVVVELAESTELPPERLAEPIEALEAGAPPELVRLGLWVAREYCSTPSRGLQLVLPPGTGRRAGAGPPAARAAGRAPTAAGEALAAATRLGSRSARCCEAGLRAAMRAARARGAQLEAAAPTAQTLRRLEERGLIAPARRACAAGGLGRWRSAPGRADRSCPPSRARRWRADRRRARRRAASASCCCTASPARARPRSTWPRSRRRWSGAGARSCSSPRSA